MALHWNPFYKSMFAEKKDSFSLRMQRALQAFSGVPTANDNLYSKTHEERKNEAVLGIFDYLTLGLPAGIHKLRLILKRFILDKNTEYTGFLFGCLKGLAVLAAIPTFLASVLFDITRFLFGVVGMLVTFPITVVATLKKYEGPETKKVKQNDNQDNRMSDPYVKNISSSLTELSTNPPVNNYQLTNVNILLDSQPHDWTQNPFVPFNNKDVQSSTILNHQQNK